jgi:hypothetical protein
MHPVFGRNGLAFDLVPGTLEGWVLRRRCRKDEWWRVD